jgi:hypothetical protein
MSSEALIQIWENEHVSSTSRKYKSEIHISMTLQRQADANSEHRDSHLSPEMVCFPGEL